MTTTPSSSVVEAEGLTKRYGERAAVDRISLTIRAGEVYGFLGPNGAGKTTTLRMLVGLVRPTSGRVSVLGHRPGEATALSRIGALIEGPGFYPYLSGRGNLTVIARYAGVSRSRVEEVLHLVDLEGRGDDKFASYSLGMKQRLGVAAALLKDPELVILDEPTNGLDPAGMRDMRALVRRLGSEGRTVILSSHLMGEVQQICDRVGVISNGRVIAESTVADLLGNGELVVAATPSDRARAVLDGIDVIEQVTARDGRLHLRVDEMHTASITRALVEAGLAVTEVHRAERELEDVFFEMTESGAAPAVAQEREVSHV